MKPGIDGFGCFARHLLAFALLLAGAGCLPQSAPVVGASTATSLPAAGVTPTAPAVQPTPQSTAVISEDAPKTLTLWLPPQFDPTANTPAARLLSERLKSFGMQHPGIRIDVRIKASSGPSGLLETLTAASAAAPLALPSLVALPRTDLETAALKGLVVSFDSFSQSIDDSDWYDYARQLALVQGGTFGLPFAGDAMLFLYHPNEIGGSAQAEWSSILRQGQPLVIPASDSRALVTLALYRSAGGSVEDAQHRPVLQPEILTQVLKLYADGAQQGVFPTWVTQYQTDGQAWQAFREQKAQAVITWSSRYLTELPADVSAAPLPALGARPVTLADGWLWAIAEPRPELREASARLAEYLCESEFLAQWTAAAGYLPPRPTALAAWQNKGLQSLLSQVVLAAEVVPPNDVTNSLGPVLQNATVQVMQRQSDAVQAAQSAAERLIQP